MYSQIWGLMFALFVGIKDAHTQQTITMNAQIQMMLGKLVVAMTANDGGISWNRFETQHYQHDMNLIRTTYFDLRTETVFAYAVCCVHVASSKVQSKYEHFFI